MRRKVGIGLGVVVLLLGGLVLACEFVFWPGLPNTGGYRLTVEVAGGDDPPQRVSLQPQPDATTAEAVSKRAKLTDDEGYPLAAADPFAGGPMVVPVECQYDESLFGRKTNWSQFPCMVVMAEWDDGRRVAKVVTLPDGRATRTLRVELP